MTNIDVSTAASLIRVVAEHSEKYSLSTQRTLLEGIFQLSSLCEETLDERTDASSYEGIKANLMLVRLFASSGLKHGNLSDAIRLAGECFAPAATVPSELDFASSEPLQDQQRSGV